MIRPGQVLDIGCAGIINAGRSAGHAGCDYLDQPSLVHVRLSFGVPCEPPCKAPATKRLPRRRVGHPSSQRRCEDEAVGAESLDDFSSFVFRGPSGGRARWRRSDRPPSAGDRSARDDRNVAKPIGCGSNGVTWVASAEGHKCPANSHVCGSCGLLLHREEPVVPGRLVASERPLTLSRASTAPLRWRKQGTDAARSPGSPANPGIPTSLH